MSTLLTFYRCIYNLTEFLGEGNSLDRCHPIRVVVATLNEEKGVGPTLEEIKKVMPSCDLVVVDGNSSDKTVEIAKINGAKVLIQNGTGKGDAMFQAIKSTDLNVQYVVFTDADFTYPAVYVPKMIEILEQNPNVGMVIGNRFNGEHNFDKSITNLFYIGNRLLAFAQYAINGVKLQDPLSGLRAVRFEIFKDWDPKSDGFDVEVEMNAFVVNHGYNITEIPIKYRSRLGEKKLKLRHGFEILKRILFYSNRN